MAKLKVPVSARDHVQGPDDADVTLVEYGDFECPHCGRAHTIVKQVQDRFGDRLRLVYRHFPLREIHPNAEAAAETSEFAGAQDRFWEMHDLLFENQDALGLPLLVESAEALASPRPPCGRRWPAANTRPGCRPTSSGACAAA